MNRNLKMQSKRLLAVGSNHSCHSGEGIGNWEDKSAEGRGIQNDSYFVLSKKKKKTFVYIYNIVQKCTEVYRKYTQVDLLWSLEQNLSNWSTLTNT